MKKKWVILLSLLVALCALRLYLPTLVKNYANRVLSDIPGYRGHIEDVDIHLWRGAYSIQGLQLLKTEGKVPVPFFAVDRADLALYWRDLFRGQLAGKLELKRPQLNFVTGNTEAQKQTSIDKSWKDQVQKLSPLRMSQLRIRDGEIHFRNYQANPPIDLHLTQLNALATNLTNSRRLSRTRKATLEATGVVMEKGEIQTHIKMDPLGDKPNFIMDFELKGLPLPRLNAFFKEYAAVEVRDGMFSFYGEGEAKDGWFEGYAKPLIDHLDIVRIKNDASIGEAIKGFIVKIISAVMENHDKDRLATKIKISGEVSNPDADVWSAISSFLGNWLVKAISPGLDHKR